jgi:hypothetical protein
MTVPAAPRHVNVNVNAARLTGPQAGRYREAVPPW